MALGLGYLRLHEKDQLRAVYQGRIIVVLAIFIRLFFTIIAVNWHRECGPFQTHYLDNYERIKIFFRLRIAMLFLLILPVILYSRLGLILDNESILMILYLFLPCEFLITALLIIYVCFGMSLGRFQHFET
jgi:hypothetical protein